MEETFKFWCLIEGDSDCFDVSVSSTQSIYELKEKIHAKNRNFSTRYDLKDLTLLKVHSIIIST